ncbi:MAG: NAD(+) synthase [Prevotella sp.]
MYGYIKVAAAVPPVQVANPAYNAQQAVQMIRQAHQAGVSVVCFPELNITGYSCQDLFRSRSLMKQADDALLALLRATASLSVIAIVGMPVATGVHLYNCAVVVQGGQILGVVPKTFLPNYGEFYEQRWFASASRLKHAQVVLAGQQVELSGRPHLFHIPGGATFGIEICEDVWAPIPPSSVLTQLGAQLVFNLSASNELIGKHQYLLSLLAQQSARTFCGYVYAGQGYGESTQDVVYGGNALIYSKGRQLAASERFCTSPQMAVASVDVEMLDAERMANTTFGFLDSGCEPIHTVCQPMADTSIPEVQVNPLPFIPTEADMDGSCKEILDIQAMGLARRIEHTHSRTVVVGISGGLDSTLALLVCVRAFRKLHLPLSGIMGVTMPGFGTTGRTHGNALQLMQALGVSTRDISIADAVTQHFRDICHDATVHDVTYENSQARERTQILMDLANSLGGMVIGTGDMSELALGWATYNGDHMSMYGVNAGVPKTLIRHLVRYEAMQSASEVVRTTLLDIIDTPISPELIPASSDGRILQVTEDLVGPYELHDFFLYYFLRYGFSASKILFMAERAFDGHDSRATRYSRETIKHWIDIFFHRFVQQQYKRSCLPDGPKVGSVSLSPRGDWRMPSDSCFKADFQP